MYKKIIKLIIINLCCLVFITIFILLSINMFKNIGLFILNLINIVWSFYISINYYKELKKDDLIKINNFISEILDCNLTESLFSLLGGPVFHILIVVYTALFIIKNIEFIKFNSKDEF